jgi:hypothetical protein
MSSLRCRFHRTNGFWRILWFASVPLSFLLVEAFGFLFLACDQEQHSLAQFWPLAFAALWALMAAGLVWLLPRKMARIFYGIFYFLLVLYAGFQTGYYLLFGQMMWLSDFRYASEGADYASVLLGYPVEWWLGLAALIVLGGLLVEIVLTFIFVIAILGVTSKRAGHGSFGGLVIGLTLVGIVVLIQYSTAKKISAVKA